jgi:hypothetical protein
MLSSPRILVIGGTGVVGRIIATELARAFPGAEVIAASRTAVPANVDGVRFEPLDICDPNALLAALSDIDLAVVAAGPFDDFRASIHRTCIDAAVDVVDINDSATAAAEIVDLDRPARTQGVRILTGMGLAPGLSTLLLFKLLGRDGPRPEHCRVRLYMGARNSGGPSNSSVLLEGFKRHLPALSDGETMIEPAGWSGPDARFTFPGRTAPVRLLPFASPEFMTLPAFGSTRALGLRSLDWRYHVQFLPAGVGRFLAATGITRSRRVIALLARSFHRSGLRMRQRPDADETTTLVVAPKSGSANCAIHGPVATSHLTATMATAAAVHLLGDGKDLQAGVYPLERLLAEQPAVEAGIDRWIARRGIIIVDDGAPKDETDFRAIFGDSATFDGTAQSLRNYGRCWYSAMPIPPKIKAYQQACLRRSQLWMEVCARTSWPARVALMMRMRRKHKRLRRLAAQQVFGLRGGATVNAEIVRDFSLFAAGFGEARDLLGHEALRLYADMFLESSAMEMAWLWPSAQVFAAADHPKAVLTDYIEAYVDACRRLGVMTAHFERCDDGFEITVERCAYAQILEALDCAELGGLIREMEVRAISERAAACGLASSWLPGAIIGTGRLVVEQRNLASRGRPGAWEAAE